MFSAGFLGRPNGAQKAIWTSVWVRGNSTFLPFILISTCSDKEVITRMGFLYVFRSFEDPQREGLAIQTRLVEEVPGLPKGTPC